jgi:galactokinase
MSMIAGALAEALVDRGLDPVELQAKRRLFELVLDGFAGIGATPRHAWWVPGRLEVFGKHTDYAGGRSLVCAVPRGFVVAAAPRTDGIVRIVDARKARSVEIRALPDLEPLTGWRRYVEVVVRRLARNFPGASIAADIVLASDLPSAAGMSSSSALMVSVATALVRMGDIDRRDEWRANIATTLDAAGYLGCVENGSRFGNLAGDTGVGTHGGSEDHGAILGGRAGRLTALTFVPMREIGGVAMPDGWRFVLSPSGVAAEKTGRVRDLYNRLSRGAGALLELWTAAEGPVRSLGAALTSRADALDRLRALVDRSAVTGFTPGELHARLEHFVREDARIPDAIDAFAGLDAARLGELSDASQRDAEALLGNQIAETTALAADARAAGAFAASSFGAGFGGSVWALVRKDDADDLARRLRPDAFVAVPGPPVTML